MIPAYGCLMKSHVESWNAVVTLRTAAHFYFMWRIKITLLVSFVAAVIRRGCILHCSVLCIHVVVSVDEARRRGQWPVYNLQ